MDMQKDIMAECSYGKAALKKLHPTPDNFRLYAAEWLGDNPREFTVMKVTGAEFRIAKHGRDAGKLSVMVKGTNRSAYVTSDEMHAFE